MQQPNASPLKPPLGLPIPSSPADSGFLPRREFLPSSSKKPLSTFSLLTFSNTSSLRVAAFPQPVVHALHRFFEDRKLLRMFRDNRSPLKDKGDIERDRGPESRGFDRPEEEELAEFTLTAKFWANAKTLETEKLLIQILILINSLGYVLLSSIDFAREPGDKLTLVFERNIPPGTSPQQQFGHQANGSTTSHSHQNSLSNPPSTGHGIQQQIFGLSFTSQTSFRCICPPLESTPGILQALRNAWPKGVEVENKVAEGCYEFKLKGYAFFADDTFQTDALALMLSILKSLQRLQFSLISSLSLSNSHSRNKDLWLFSTTEPDALSPHQLLSAISASPASYTVGSISGMGSLSGVPPGSSLPGSRQTTGDKDDKKLVVVSGGHMRSASADTNQTSSTFAPGHQRHATTPAFTNAFNPGQGSVNQGMMNQGMLNQGNTISPSGTITSATLGGKPGRQQGSVLVKKLAKTSPKPTASTVLPLDSNITPPTGGRTNTPPKAPTPPSTSNPAFPPSASATKQGLAVGALPAIAPKPTPKGQFQQQVLYSTPTSGNVLYSTPPASPPGTYGNFPPSPSMGAAFVAPGPPPPLYNVTGPSPPSSPAPGKVRGSSHQSRPNAIDLPANSFSSAEDEGDGPTPPLLSSATFRDTMLDQERDAITSVLSVRSGESFDVPVMWTGGLSGVGGGLGAVGAGLSGGLGTTLEEKEEEEEGTVSPTVPGGWVDDSTSTSTAKPRTKDSSRPSKEKERTFDAKVDGAQIVNVSPSQDPEQAQRASITSGGGADDLHRRKSQEAVVHTIPGSESRKDGWVMVNVSGDQRNKVVKPRRTPSATVSPSMASVEPTTSTIATTADTKEGKGSIIAPPIPPFVNEALGSGSGEESSGSHDRKDISALKSEGTKTTKKSGFRRLFSRGDKEKDKDKGSDKVSPESAGKRVRWGTITSEPVRGVRRSTID